MNQAVNLNFGNGEPETKKNTENSIQLKNHHSINYAHNEKIHMKAGIDSLEVKWKKSDNAGPTKAKLRLDYKAKFKKDDDHKSVDAEFRQNAGSNWEITAGTHSGQSKETALRDDNYSKAVTSETMTA